jgi:hypothetical protein
MSRRHRIPLGTALFLVWSLLFAQLALAQYVCPRQGDAEVMARMMADGLPCEGMDLQQPALCHQHSADPGKTFEALKLPVATLPAIVHVLELPLVLHHESASVVPPTANAEAWPPPDPLFLSTLRLRV